jgi:hypothetical protein
VRNLLALLGLAIVLFAGLGWYLGWYHVALTPTPNGHKKVEFDINTSKVHDDVSAGIDKGKQLVDSFRKDGPPAEGSKDFVGPPKPESLTPPAGKPVGTGPVPFK